MQNLIKQTQGLCPTCKQTIPALVIEREGKVYLDKTCPTHGSQVVCISENAAWYRQVIEYSVETTAPLSTTHPVSQGCPHDCGPCSDHEQRLHLPVVPITSACNLDCPICYTHNRSGDDAFHMAPDEFRTILKHLRTMAPEGEFINLTGGEPTLHPQLIELFQICQDEGITRITLSTHGMKCLHDDDLMAALVKYGVRVILSFDSFEQDANEAMLGGRFLEPKLAILERLEEYGINTTLLPVLARGQNDHELAAFVNLALNHDFIRSVEFHPMTFTGHNGVDFDRNARYGTWVALRDLESQSKGALRVSDFVPAPLAHPLCYQITYLLRLQDGRWLPFARFMTPNQIRALLTQGIYLMPSAQTDRVLGEVINDLWSGAVDCDEADAVLDALHDLIDAMREDGPGKLTAAERFTKAIYAHPYGRRDL